MSNIITVIHNSNQIHNGDQELHPHNRDNYRIGVSCLVWKIAWQVMIWNQ